MKRALITGGAGFIGTNLADRLISLGVNVRILDNLSRMGAEDNVRWLRKMHPSRFELCVGDVRSACDVENAMEGVDQVFHFAAQVAVTTSVIDPFTDFQVNAGGTLNVLEAARHRRTPPAILFTSTNKVYGALTDIALRPDAARYVPIETKFSAGIRESRPLDFHSPYGCSKGAADQYVLDYSRIYGLRTIVFRMSCIYGCRQRGNEDQGWVAHFVKESMSGNRLTVYGDGRQVRDVLFAEDLIDAFLAAQTRIDELSGQAFNMGGGLRNTTSLLELIELLNELNRSRCRIVFSGWRPGDQRYYVTDYSRFRKATGWGPRVNVREGVARLHHWLAESHRATAAQEA